MSRIAQPAHGGASSPSSSPGSRPRGRSAACRAPRLWEGGDEAWLDSNADNHLVHLPILCSFLTPSTTTTSREWQGLRTMTRREPTTAMRPKTPNHRAWKNLRTIHSNTILPTYCTKLVTTIPNKRVTTLTKRKVDSNHQRKLRKLQPLKGSVEAWS